MSTVPVSLPNESSSRITGQDGEVWGSEPEKNSQVSNEPVKTFLIHGTIDTDAVLDWTHRQLPSPGSVDGILCDRIADEVHGTLQRSGHSIHRIRCWADHETLVLTGTTTTYYQLQIAITAALKHAGQRRIVNRIQVRATVPPRP